ncbi:MAG: Zn-ribbon domain-containing OB-fold protein [Candidatus Tectomicrobia bacterium]|nr:Zn-ribbon domain-containing OB-fold protein [Candidatus Tectomicrobia bacterium]
MAEWKKPLPRITPETKTYWEGCKRHELVIPHCKDCGEYYFYPRALCPYCFSSNIEFVKSNGKGKVHTFTVTYQNRARGFVDEVPYVMAWVELPEQGNVQLMSNIIDCEPEDVKVGMPVQVVFVDATDEITIPLFKPA